jgi:hypothetical protein
VDIDKATTKVEVETSNLINILTQQTMSFDILFFLPHLLARKTHGKKMLFDYSQNHVKTLEEYLGIIR